MVLHLDDDELSTCVACGLCLPHCPTYRVTGEEALSPRGRIDAMRSVERRGAPIDDRFVEIVETCVQCRGCEPACPSGVPYGRLIEGTREALADRGRTTPWWQRWGLRALGRRRLVLGGSRLLAVAQRLRLVPARLGVPELPVRNGAPVASTGDDVWLFTGCVMDAWARDTHRSTAAVLEAIGVRHRVPGDGAACCGALHTHAGLGDDARRLARRVMAALPGDAPIVVNSAGCGAALKDYGHLLGSPEAAAFSARVVDVHELVARHADRLADLVGATAPSGSSGSSGVDRRAVIVQDPCHLRHVQRTHDAVRTVLATCATVVELDDEGLCCGAGGAYSVFEPELATAIRARKQDAIARAAERSGARIVASANPGCLFHLRAVGLDVRHPMDLVAEALP